MKGKPISFSPNFSEPGQIWQEVSGPVPERTKLLIKCLWPKRPNGLLQRVAQRSGATLGRPEVCWRRRASKSERTRATVGAAGFRRTETSDGRAPPEDLRSGLNTGCRSEDWGAA